MSQDPPVGVDGCSVHLRRTHLGRGLSYCGSIGATCTDLRPSVTCPLCRDFMAMEAMPAPPSRYAAPWLKFERSA